MIGRIVYSPTSQWDGTHRDLATAQAHGTIGLGQESTRDFVLRILETKTTGSTSMLFASKATP
jgi:hypothetical protein